MKLVGLAVVVFGSACLISPVMKFGGGKSPQQAQRDTMSKVLPPALVVDAEWSGEVSKATIRVWADDHYRAQHVRWQQSFQEQLDYANEVLASQFGVRLTAEYGAWQRHAPSATLAETLAALAQHDRGDGALAVIGLTSSLSLVSATFDQLGVAMSPGVHLVLRGHSDAEERAAFERFFSELGAEERTLLYEARRRHKTTSMLLHELAHNLGAAHADEPDTLMSPAYSHGARAFDTASRAIILATLDDRLQRRPNTPIQDTHPTLVITIDATGRAIIGGNAVDDATLDALLRMSFEDDRETSVVVRSRSAALAAKLVARTKAAGLQRVRITVD